MTENKGWLTIAGIGGFCLGFWFCFFFLPARADAATYTIAKEDCDTLSRVEMEKYVSSFAFPHPTTRNDCVAGFAHNGTGALENLSPANPTYTFFTSSTAVDLDFWVKAKTATSSLLSFGVFNFNGLLTKLQATTTITRSYQHIHVSTTRLDSIGWYQLSESAPAILEYDDFVVKGDTNPFAAYTSAAASSVVVLVDSMATTTCSIGTATTTCISTNEQGAAGVFGIVVVVFLLSFLVYVTVWKR